MIHDYDERTKTRYQVWHNDRRLEGVITHFVETERPSCFVETGTHMGWTAAWMAARFPWLPIFTVEVDDGFFALSSHNVAEFPTVANSKMGSVVFLEKLVPMLMGGKPMFWLDAHWWPPEPLRDECAIVSKLPKYVAFIDDFQCKSPDFHGDTFNYGRDPVCLSYVADILGASCWRPDYPPEQGNVGYGMFIKNVAYTPPRHMKMDRL